MFLDYVKRERKYLSGSVLCVQDLKKALELSRREFDFSQLEEEREQPPPPPESELPTLTGTRSVHLGFRNLFGGRRPWIRIPFLRILIRIQLLYT